jgi:hypothetical protein
MIEQSNVKANDQINKQLYEFLDRERFMLCFQILEKNADMKKMGRGVW